MDGPTHPRRPGLHHLGKRWAVFWGPRAQCLVFVRDGSVFVLCWVQPCFSANLQCASCRRSDVWSPKCAVWEVSATVNSFLWTLTHTPGCMGQRLRLVGISFHTSPGHCGRGRPRAFHRRRHVRAVSHLRVVAPEPGSVGRVSTWQHVDRNWMVRSRCKPDANNQL